MVRFAAAVLAFAASFMAVSASANVPGHAAAQNLNRRQDAEPATPAEPSGLDSETDLEDLMNELGVLVQDVKELVTDAAKKPTQSK